MLECRHNNERHINIMMTLDTRLWLAVTVLASFSALFPISTFAEQRAPLAPAIVREMVPCTDEYVATAAAPAGLRGIVEACQRSHPNVALAALGKLNSLELPASLPLWPVPEYKPARKAGKSVQLTLYFDPDESYPTPVGLEELRGFVAKLNQIGGRILSVNVEGGVDAREQDSALSGLLAQGRADAARKYLEAAGLPKATEVGLTLRLRSAKTGDLAQLQPAEVAQERYARVVVVVESD